MFSEAHSPECAQQTRLILPTFPPSSMGQSKCLVIPHLFKVSKPGYIRLRSTSREVLATIGQSVSGVWTTKRVTLATTERVVVIETERAANTPDDVIGFTNLVLLPHSCDGNKYFFSQYFCQGFRIKKVRLVF